MTAHRPTMTPTHRTADCQLARSLCRGLPADTTTGPPTPRAPRSRQLPPDHAVLSRPRSTCRALTTTSLRAPARAVTVRFRRVRSP